MTPDGESYEFGGLDGEVEAKLQVHNENFFSRCILYSDIGFGESYVEGDWTTDSITNVIRWMILNWENNPGVSGSRASAAFVGVLRLFHRFKHLTRDNSLKGAIKNISAHYDLSNELFETFLDPSMTYSCADFTLSDSSLEAAQMAKFERLAKSAKIRGGESVLEIGGGWGAFAIYLASKYGCKVTTITISKNQFDKMQQRVQQLGLTGQIDVRFVDYRHVEGKFDRIVSVEMLEAVGHKHLRSFFATADRLLNKNGLLAVQVITSADSRYDQLKEGIDWIQTHIFPGSLLPSLAAMTEATKAVTSLQMFSLHHMGHHYAKTLRIWRENFNAALPRVKHLGFDERFIRSWNYYLSYCEAAFEMRHIDLAQIVYTRPNNIELNL